MATTNAMDGAITSVAEGGTGVTASTGTVAVVLSTSPTLVTPLLGTPTSGVLTNCTGLPVAGGGTGIATTTAYSVICAGTTATGAFQSLAALGAAATVLTSNGAGALPSFQAAGGGSEIVLLATGTASTSATLDFTSLISSSYSKYEFVFEDLVAATTSATFQVLMSSNNGSTYVAALYSTVGDWASQTTPSYGGDANTTTGTAIYPNVGAASSRNGTATLKVSSTANVASFVSQINSPDSQLIRESFVACYSVVTVNAIRFKFSAGNITSGKIYMYGVKNT